MVSTILGQIHLDILGEARILLFRRGIMIGSVIRWGIVLAVLVAGEGVRAADAVFDAPRQYPMGLRYTSAIADVNRDGLPDILTPVYLSDSVGVALNDGNNGLEPSFGIHVRPGVYSIAISDINGDGWFDMACTHQYYPEDLYVYLNDGHMTFTVTDSLIGLQAGTPRFDDFNGDGHVDMLVSQYATQSNVLYFGDGTGAFNRQETLPFGYVGLRPFDVDNDSDPDLCYKANGWDPGPVIVLRNNGAGEFLEADTCEVHDGLQWVAPVDINGDGWMDLIGPAKQIAIPNYLIIHGGILALLNRGNGQFEAPRMTYPEQFRYGTPGLLAGDLDADGDDDLIAGWGDGKYEVFESTGYGYFQSIETASLSSGYLQLSDFDRDGDADVLYVSGGLTVLENTGQPVFDLPTFYPRVGFGLVDLCDFDQDGYLDIVVVSRTEKLIVLIRNDGTGDFSGWKSYRLCDNFYDNLTHPTNMVIGDVNGDELPDLVALCGQSGGTELQMFLSGGDDVLDPYPVYHDLGERAQNSIEIADINGDGRMDVIGMRSFYGDLTVSYGDSAELLLPPVEIPLDYKPSHFVTGDLDQNGDSEVILVDDSSIHVLDYEAGQGLIETSAVSAPHQVGFITLADLTDDGHPDLLTEPVWPEAGLLVYINDGLGSLDPTPVTTDLGFGSRVVTGHIDRDKHVDICVLGGRFNITTLFGNGDGSFGEPVGHFGASSGGGLMGDLDLDGYDDLIVSSPGGFRVVWNIAGDVTSTDDYQINELLPADFVLGQNYPNPFNPETVIDYSLPLASHVRLTIYNILGQEVVTLTNQFQSPGDHSVMWTGKDSHNRHVASGVYFYRLTTGDRSEARKMLLLK